MKVISTNPDEEKETDLYFSDDEVLKAIKEGIDDIKNGRVTTIKDPSDIWQDIQYS